MTDLVVAWDRDYRHGPGPDITVHPTGTSLIAAGQLQLAVPRRDATIVVTWTVPARPR
ncbi:hypothetical protein [Actinoplanes sp. NPDC049118]|uniref:hypothetical protein n=1 Tax=Actinoplanes sp. NPDC049118 TaxID=3155769 RepID=UPI003404D5D0